MHPLLSGLVDYAGLFPPASLDLEQAIEEYATLVRRADAPMLGRFICPVARLTKLSAFSGLFDSDHPLRLSLLVPVAEGSTHPGESIAHALRRGTALSKETGGVVRVEVVETRFTPAVVAGKASAVRAALCEAADASGHTPVYVELPVAREPETALRALRHFGAVRRAGRSHLGSKVRCGGALAEDYPTVENLARFIHLCLSDGVPFKATAGLHHPVRGVPSGVGPPMHGFLNVFGAAVIGAALDLGEGELAEIVAETDVAAFSLADGRVAWRGQTAPLPAVQAVRTGLAHAFGSCSFDEPADDLRSLGWLPPIY